MQIRHHQILHPPPVAVCTTLRKVVHAWTANRIELPHSADTHQLSIPSSIPLPRAVTCPHPQHPVKEHEKPTWLCAAA